MSVTYGSVCSGIESASVAWEPLGMVPLWFSEIEKFPCAVLEHHWPQVPNHGDMTILPELVRCGLVDAPDVLVGGTPCQAFSVAGKQLSLDDDARGQLTIVYGDLLNAIDEVRNTPAVAVWENVPGVLSTSDNAFGWFLGMLAGEFTLVDITSGTAKPLEAQPGASRQKWPKSGCIIGPKRTVAWRVLDAQYFGVAQRRRRVFVVASAREGFDPAEVLFEREGLRRDIAPSRSEGEDITGRISPILASGKDVVGTLMANAGTKRWLGNQEAFSGDYRILHPAYGIPGNWIGRKPNNGGNATEPMLEVSPCLTKTDKHGVSFQYRARYLLPVECERLQGFPDGHTDIPSETDTARYQAIGNSKAVPVVQWIGVRLLCHLL